jgi:hypothetical protein
MQRYFGALTIVLLLGMVWVRVLLMRRKGIKAVKFGRIDKKDFLIPPFAIFYFYIVFAAAFHFPGVSRQELFHSAITAWGGMLLCLAGLSLLCLTVGQENLPRHAPLIRAQLDCRVGANVKLFAQLKSVIFSGA